MTYGTFAGFQAYHAARGRDVSAYDEAAVNPALLVSSEWIDSRYRSAFNGEKVGQREQAREWPRSGASDVYGYGIASDVIPFEVDNATYELGYRQLAAPFSLSADFTPPKYESVSIDGALSVKYARVSSAWDMQSQYVIIDQILSNLLSASAAGSYLSGAVSRK